MNNIMEKPKNPEDDPFSMLKKKPKVKLIVELTEEEEAAIQRKKKEEEE